MRLLGHRGASADFPENTLPAFLGALAQGADGVELDVQVCATGEVVVGHDEWLDRLAWRHLEVARTSWSKLKTLDVGTALGFPPATMPLLAQVLEALPRHAVINVELKCETLDDRGLTDATARVVEQAGALDRVFFSSFNAWCLVRLAVRLPRARRGLLLDPDRAWRPQALVLAPMLSRTSVHPHHGQVTLERVTAWHRLGLEVAAWTVDSPARARTLEALGVDWLITNRPAVVREALTSSTTA